MKALISIAIPLLSCFAAGAYAQQPAAKTFGWAYPVPDPPPAAAPDAGPKTLPGSTKSYTQAQIDDQFKPPDWFPQEHSPLPRVVERPAFKRRPAGPAILCPDSVIPNPPAWRAFQCPT
jgi:hypothetical protein